jgi:hypothetical protein
MTNLKASFRLATPDDYLLETYDHTKLSAINTCPTYGILKYQMHKSMPSEGRAMALEAGSAMHECFSFIRMVSLMQQYVGRPEFQDKLWDYNGNRLFGAERMDYINTSVDACSDHVEVAKVGALAVLETSGFFDDPRDKRRTLSNLEECIYAYVNRWRWDHPVWMRDVDDPLSDVGIEIPFDLVVDIGGLPIIPKAHMEFRLTGRIDGIHYNTNNELTIHDNKTASRLGDAWSQSFLLSHQITGYCAAASTFIEAPVHKAEILGLAIPLPRTYDYGGYVREVVPRYDYHYARWLSWLVHTITLARQYMLNPYDAPKYTHSCNRYFRPCPMIPFCDADDDEQHRIVDQMVHEEWSPLNKPILDGIGNE